MINLVFILITIALLAGFLFLVNYEVRRGARLCESMRARFDRDVIRVNFILKHVDLGVFLRDELQRFIARAGHDIAHFSLQLVRIIERLLTRLVRHLRTRHTVVDTVPRENVREFVKTLSDFKGQLTEGRSDVGETKK